MVENIGRFLDNSRFGIATLQPNRSIRRCRIRNLRVEYIMSDSAIILTLPKSCRKCGCMNDCTDDFILQILEKIARQTPSGEARYHLP